MIRAGSKSKSMKDFIASTGGSSPARERASLSLSAVKALVLREKEDNLTSEFSSDEKVVHLINSLFDPGMCIIGGLLMMHLRICHFSLTHYPVMVFHFRYNICKIFAEGDFLRRKINSDPEETAITSLPRDIHGAPPESLVVKLAEIIGNYKTLRKMALFWCRVVAEVCLTQK